MIDHTTEKDSAELASEQGFTGTFAGFISWLEDALVYGAIQVEEPSQDDLGRTVTRVRTATGGFSSDERLLGRIRRNYRLTMFWVSSHRGGGTVWEFPERVTTSDERRVWLEPDDGVFERLMRARRVRVYSTDGSYLEHAYEHGVEFAFEEPDRDIMEPDGIVMVRPAPSLDELYGPATGEAE
ncbi:MULTISPECIES: hypothetical protein [unclassified Microbacterium]|uniref:hypothetical protein n=1 Tax=unclassified Microbacterium TaxID=2609290 RepID=UPI002883323A|nr:MULTISPECIES: hypothetical protein [unclassified Microbacterium]